MAEASSCTVNITSGPIRGTVTPLPDGSGPCYTFKGIPYAVPPVGPLRFQPPQPLTHHSDDGQAALDCTRERAVSLASSYLPPNPPLASEDCLYLNVYTPKNPTALDDSSDLPVMVWLHGGAFCTGSGDSSIYHPEWLVAMGPACVVTVNYRLGPAGFLCLPSVGIYGNMGLKDQRLALQWVRANIGRFGGDAHNVTLFGESAGGVSAHLHYLSQASYQLFHKLICQSGVATTSITFQQHPEQKARRLAEYFGCPPDASDREVLDTLLNVPPEQLAKSQKEALTAHEKTLDSVYAFRPVVESSDAIDPIVTENAFDLLRSFNRPAKPMILGVVSEEALYKINTFRQHLQRYRDDKGRFIPDLLNVPAGERSEVADHILAFYCGTTEVTLEKEFELSRIFTDTMYLIPTVQAAELHLRRSKSDIFFYHFGAETELNKFRQQWKVPAEYRGASHADDVCYLFSASFFHTDAVEQDSPAWKLRKAMCRLWTSFARRGVPRLNSEEVLWTPLEEPTTESFNLTALNIDHQCGMRMVPNHLADRVGFWRALFKKYNGDLLGRGVKPVDMP